MQNVVPASCLLNQEFLARVKTPVLHTWNAIAADMCDCEEELTNEIAIETCIDSDRLFLSGGDEEANLLVREQCKIHGYTKVLKFLSRNIQLV